MTRPPKLTDWQKEKLHKYEPALREAVRLGQYGKAKYLTKQIQDVLRPTGHETRLMKAKNWYFEAAMESGRLSHAIQGFIGIRKKVSNRTRIHLEATALLAICHLRNQDLAKAEPLIREVLLNDDVIRTEHRRIDFRQNIIRRFEEEGALAALRGKGTDVLEPVEIQKEAGILIGQGDDNTIFLEIGRAVPNEVISFLLEIDDLAKRQLPAHEIKLLPSKQEQQDKKNVGRTVFSSMKRVLWRSLCDPDSDVYKAWFNEGMMVVLDKKYITSAIIASMANMGIGIKALAVSFAALIIKIGIEVFCDRYAPEGIMDVRRK